MSTDARLASMAAQAQAAQAALDDQGQIFNSPRRDRPWLLPSNRKLRHLQGIAIRNLTLSPTSSRPRGQTIDDASLPQTWKTSAKILALRENNVLAHSKSSTDLSSQSTEHSAQTAAESKETPTEDPLQRQAPGRLRRTSTLNWAAASPGIRQKKLEDAIGDRMVDSWFSLHCEGIDDPVYISEVMPRAMNPEFTFFDLNSYGPFITRRDDLTVKLWAKSHGAEQYQLLVELHLNLRSLQFIGKSLDHFHHPLPPNSIIFHLSDGVYANLTDIPPREPIVPYGPGFLQASSSDTKPTSSYDALMRLSTLDDVIQDALVTREKLTRQIDSILKANAQTLQKINAVSGARESLESSRLYLALEKRQVKLSHKKRSELQSSLDARRTAMRQGREAQHRATQYLDGAGSRLKQSRQLLQTSLDDIHGQRRRICEDLIRIYPIEPIPNRLLHFTIASLELANSTSPTSPPPQTHTAAALGYVAHLLYLLSLYLSTPLPYPPMPHGSTSHILDPISLMPSSHRAFPLFEPGSTTYRFEYAVFLLNKDIEALLCRQGLKVLDLRHTLPNLKYLMYVLAAGEAELPSRGKGGVVRGLFRPMSPVIAPKLRSSTRRLHTTDGRSDDGGSTRSIDDDGDAENTGDEGTSSTVKVRNKGATTTTTTTTLRRMVTETSLPVRSIRAESGRA